MSDARSYGNTGYLLSHHDPHPIIVKVNVQGARRVIKGRVVVNNIETVREIILLNDIPGIERSSSVGLCLREEINRDRLASTHFRQGAQGRRSV